MSVDVESRRRANHHIRLTHVACPRVQEKDSALGDHCALVGDVPDGSPRQGQAKDGEIPGGPWLVHWEIGATCDCIPSDIPKTLFDHGRNITTFLIIIGRAHGLILAVHLLNCLGSLVLDRKSVV